MQFPIIVFVIALLFALVIRYLVRRLAKQVREGRAGLPGDDVVSSVSDSELGKR